MSAFAFFGGVADTYTDIEAAKVKAKAKAAKAQKETDKENQELFADQMEKTNVIFGDSGVPLITFSTPKGGQNQKEIVARQYSLSKEIASTLKEMKLNINNDLDGNPVEGAVDGYIVKTDAAGKTTKKPTTANKAYLELTTNPFYVDQVRALTSSASVDALEMVKRDNEQYFYKDYDQYFPHVNYFPTIRDNFDKVTGAGYRHDSTDEAVWGRVMTRKYGKNWEASTANNGGLSKDEQNLKEALGIYGSLVKNDFASEEELTKGSKRFIELEIFDKPDAFYNAAGEYHPRRIVKRGDNAPFSGIIDSKQITQVDSADSKKAPLVRETAFNIAKLTADLQTYLLDMSATGELQQSPAGGIPLAMEKIYDQIFAPGGAMEYMPATINKIINNIKGDDQFISGIKYNGQSMDFNEFLNQEVGIPGTEKTMTIQTALDITGRKGEYAKNPNIWKSKVGAAGLFLSTEISLAFSVAIARQDFEGGKAVSDPDFERSLSEIRADGGMFGNATAIAKKYSALRHEFAQKSLRYGITEHLKTNNQTHAIQAVSNNFTRITNSANAIPYEDGSTFSDIVGRGLFVKLMLKDDRPLHKRILNLEQGTDTSYLNDRDNERIKELEKLPDASKVEF